MTQLQDSILDAALSHIIFDGWTLAAVERAAGQSGFSAFDVKRAFPQGVMDVLSYFLTRADNRMLAVLAEDYDLPNMKIRERIATAVMIRLKQNTCHREAVRRAVGVYALPWNIPAATRALYATTDAIWRAAGDTSTDYNFYTKRLMLAQVYSSTLAVWLDDKTADFSETEAFLRRRIENVMQIEKFKAKTRDGLGKLSEWLPKRA